MKKGWYSRGYLPHIDAPGLTQFLTWRLGDAVPELVLQSWQDEVASLPENDRKKELLRRVEAYCDAGHGSCLLSDPRCARVVQESLFHDHGRRYVLHAWSVMPNHVHALLTPFEREALGDIVGAVKGVTAKRINRLLRQQGALWQEDYFDRFMRDAEHFERVRHYIEWNPVKAKLCTDPARFPWSSANPNARKRLEVVFAGEAPADLMRAGGPRS
jgi:REP element-mobilizing transposase RayT